MKRRQFCQALAMLLPTLAIPSARAAAPSSPQQVEAIHQQLDHLCGQFAALNFPAFDGHLDRHLLAVRDLETLNGQAHWIDSSLAAVQKLQISELSAECEARLSAFQDDLSFLKEWTALCLHHRQHPQEITASHGYEAFSAQEKANIAQMYQTGANCVYITRSRWKGLVCQSQGQRWHQLFASHWSGRSNPGAYQPDQLAQQELSRIEAALEAIRIELGVPSLKALLESPQLNLSNEDEVRKQLWDLDQKVRQLSWAGPSGPPILLQRMGKENPKLLPGYYRDGKLYYDFWDSFPRHHLVWLYLHEVLPGRHALTSRKLQGPRLLDRPGLDIAWGIYAEHLGHQNGLMQDPVHRLGWLLWDQARSARLYLDWQIHRVGWTSGQALDWWKTNLPLQSQRAYSEVEQVIQFPGQAHSHKIAEREMLALKQSLQSRLGAAFDLQQFHDRFLNSPCSSWTGLRNYL
jgi:uncharacterized protein (DUF885 family)